MVTIDEALNLQNGWADAINYIYRNPEIAAAIGKAAKEKVFRDYHPRDAIHKVEQVYGEMLSSGQVTAETTACSIEDLDRLFDSKKKDIFDRGIRYFFPRISGHLDSRRRLAGSYSSIAKTLFHLVIPERSQNSLD
jgi:hypothetical protein